MINMLTVRMLPAIYYSFNAKSVIKKFENCCSKKCLEITKLPLKKQKKFVKEKRIKKMYYSHKKLT